MTFFNRKFHHINLTVPNLEEAISFYTATLGFKLVSRFKQELEFVFVSDGNMTYELMENKELKETVFDHIAYASDDIEADFEHFKKLGITTTELGFVDYLFENGVRYFFIKGAGNDKIEFCQAL